MMKQFYLWLALLLMCATSQAQIGTMRWHFKSRDEVKSALQQTRGNLRSTYDVLICAGRQGYTNTSIGFYEDVVADHEFDASSQDSAAYAFAYDLGYSFRPWGWKIDTDQSMIKKSGRAIAQLFRDRAQSMLPNSPEVLVMRAFWERSLGEQESLDAYRATLRAVNLAPRWADAYYWLGIAATTYAGTFEGRIVNDKIKPNTKEMAQAKSTMADLGHLQLRAYDKAEKLDPGLHSYLYWPRLDAYQNIADKKSAEMMPSLVEQHLRAYPNFGTWYRQATGRTVQQFRQGYKDLAARIMAEQGDR